MKIKIFNYRYRYAFFKTIVVYIFVVDGIIFSVIMFNIKQIKSTTFKIFVGLFFSVLIYYLNNFSYVLGQTERVPQIFSITIPLLVLLSINIMMLYKVNDK